jgi:hypothetical protein
MTYSNQKSFDTAAVSPLLLNIAARATLLAELDRLMQKNAPPAPRAFADIPEHLFSTDKAKMPTVTRARR